MHLELYSALLATQKYTGYFSLFAFRVRVMLINLWKHVSWNATPNEMHNGDKYWIILACCFFSYLSSWTHYSQCACQVNFLQVVLIIWVPDRIWTKVTWVTELISFILSATWFMLFMQLSSSMEMVKNRSKNIFFFKYAVLNLYILATIKRSFLFSFFP